MSCACDDAVGEAVRALPLVDRIELHFRTREDAVAIADLIGQILPGTVLARLGLCELLLNAIEHGNLALGGKRKAELLRTGGLEAEVAARLAMPCYAERHAHLLVERAIGGYELTITDEGDGFPWRDFVRTDVDLSLEPNGRGIALACAIPGFRVRYLDPGNAVVVLVKEAT